MGNGQAGGSGGGTPAKASDSICGGSALLLWWLPAAAVIAGASLPSARAWLWIPSFLVMGVACLANAARCGRVHCYFTGPVFLLAALWVALGALHFVPMHPGALLATVLLLTLLAFLVELPLGRYRRAAEPPASRSI